ncbi:lysis protein [Klebsiella variicola]|uniref:lysis protein n=1 Tax=Klebsiella TaxID=570 RepID=UPI0020C921D8|nr:MULTISPECIES: lysis protein [Klebsiella]MCP9032520.1 lysis protein [Klebsiella sp. SWET4]MDP1292943.1 lysis protein [Klebsiella variicola]MDP1339861.1 lysis protein [Klebsiella variicola]
MITGAALALLKKTVLPGVVLLVMVAVLLAAGHYREQARKETLRADRAEHNLQVANITITDMQTRARAVASLDTRYTHELTDAKKKLGDLQFCVRTGQCGLQVNATCPVVDTAGVGRMSNATPPLTDTAERDYYTLRERISAVSGQVSYLQAYISTQCMR